MKYRLNVKKFIRFIVVCVMLVGLVWFGVSWIEICVKNCELANYNDANLIIKILEISKIF